MIFFIFIFKSSPFPFENMSAVFNAFHKSRQALSYKTKENKNKKLTHFLVSFQTMAHQTPQVKTITSLACLFLVAIMVLNAHAQAHPGNLQAAIQPESTFTSALRQVLSERGFQEEEIDEVLFSVGARLLQLMSSTASKRAGWKRIPIQTRFAPFGTKLVPSRNRGDSNGPTLLRYGRSS